MCVPACPRVAPACARVCPRMPACAAARDVRGCACGRVRVRVGVRVCVRVGARMGAGEALRVRAYAEVSSRIQKSGF